jgi:molybdenum cofactor biosynthesis enzyme
MSEPGHFSDAGRARMVDVSDKPSTSRVAIDRGMRIESI